MFTGTVSTCRIHVDLHTLAVSIVSKKEEENFSLQSVEGSEVQCVGSSIGRGDRLEDGSLCCSHQGCRYQVPRRT